ncbi:NAD-binding protein [Mycena maculata]|uniref:NAD-binding protein n=1 Tax=Mycena maculata TaxID=230809 RepID=A0AAD7J7P0_9AGAR|nr:NAD-binding protein [Mycena maculata]
MSKGTALVTGAAQGIGKAIALRLADDGFNVAVNDIPANAEKLLEVVKEIKAKGRASSEHLADVSVEEQVKSMVAEVARVHDGIDVMVANAGVTHKWATLADLSVDEWDRVMTINGRGPFLCYKYAGMQMVGQGRGGRIIGASSVVGKQGSAGFAAYTASKCAVRGLTQVAAVEFGSHGITVNAYAPGPIDTDLLADFDASTAKGTGMAPGGLKEGAKQATALKRLGTPTDIANLVSFIASKESGFITGQSLSVNGGLFFD